MTQAAQLAQYGANNVGLSFKNRIINGDMTIDQRNNGAAVTPTSLTYTVDRWAAAEQTDGSMTVQQSTVAPAGFTNSLLTTITSADASLGATQYAVLRQAVEGFNCADLGWGTANAQAVTLSFWVRSSVTGTFGGSLQNAAQDRSYPFSYTISAANTFEYKTITIPGDTTGTWLTTNGVGIQVWFGLGVGSTYLGTANAWAGSLFFAPTGAVNLHATNGATWQITGVQLEKGTVATSFDYLPYGTELQLCQRYCEIVKMTGMTGTAGDAGTKLAMAQPYKVSKRASPTLTITNATAVNYNVFRPGVEANITSPTIVVSNGDADAFMIELGAFSGLTNNDSWTGRYNAGTFLASAEL